MSSRRAGDTPIKVVVADDHEPLLRELCSLLASEFVVVAAVRDGQALVAAARLCRPDVVVTDIEMPGLDGISAAKIVLNEKLCRGVIVLTMYSDNHLMQAAKEAGIRHYLSKMNAGDRLIEAVHLCAAS
jgi:DNA-binding NarL/FixJ family response regulator